MAKDLTVSSLLDVYGAFLNEKQRELTEYYYNDDLSLSEIAENVGITRQGVRDSIKRAEQQLYALEEKCRYRETFITLQSLADEVRSGKDGAGQRLLAFIDEL